MDTEDAVVALFALAHPARLAAFRAINAAGETGLSAGQIADTIQAPANTTSSHLNVLRGAGLLQAQRKGRSIIYTAERSHLHRLSAFLLADIAPT
ncbi:MAG: metalloregulator ArsR/SmtB family transcription factor [Asticcacaulis sp.]